MIDRGELCEIGRFSKPHGLKGELSALITADVEPEALPCIFVDIDGLLVPFFIASARAKGCESTLLTLDGINSQDKATAFTKKSIYARTSDVPLDENACENDFYLEDLIGYTIVDNGKETGTITGFDDSTENYLFEIEVDNGKSTMLIPANTDLIDEIDTESKKIYMNLPQGLTDL